MAACLNCDRREETMEWEQAGAGASSGKASVKKKRGCLGRGCLVAVAVLAILFVILNISRCGDSEPEQLHWPSSGLATMLPDPPTSYGTVITDDEERLYASLEQCSQEAYSSYVDACAEMGYTVEAERTGSSYRAYNDDGYLLDLSYYDSSEDLDIELDVPVELGKIAWPTSGPGALVPAPASLRGKVTTDSSSRFAATIGDTDAAAMQAYADACMAAGFNVDYSRGDTSFSADDAVGNSVRITYKGFNTMDIAVDAADGAAPAEGTTTPVDEVPADTTDPSTASEAPASGTGTADVRATIDAYEAFMDDYIAFMTKYRDEGNPVSMLADYTAMVARYTDAVSEIDSMDENSMSAEDWAYYLEVVNRVNQKLLDASS